MYKLFIYCPLEIEIFLFANKKKAFGVFPQAFFSFFVFGYENPGWFSKYLYGK